MSNSFDEELQALLDQENGYDSLFGGFEGLASDHANRTQITHLKQYTKVVQKFKGLPETASEDEILHACFPEDHSQYLENVAALIAVVATLGKGRSASNDRVSHAYLDSFRTSMCFWAPKKYAELKIKPPTQSIISDRMKEAIRLACIKHGITDTPYSPATITPNELVHLIDHDIEDSKCVEHSEGMHFAWCIGLLCGLRPGSLGKPRDARTDSRPKRQPFLTLGNCQITRTSRRGEFDMMLEILNFKKTNSTSSSTTSQQLARNYHIKSPQVKSNLLLSPAHRVLVMALRRGAIDRISTVEELLDDPRHWITFKHQFRDTPVILAGKAKGESTMNQAATSEALTDYISLRGEQEGIEERLTFYCFRHTAATKMAGSRGNDDARDFLTHAPDTKTLEKYYVHPEKTRDVLGIALGEINSDRTIEMERNSATLLLNRLDRTAAQELYGRAQNLRDEVRDHISKKPDFPTSSTSIQGPDVRNAKRVARRDVLRELSNNAHEKKRKSLTQAEYDKRMADLDVNNSRLAKAVVKEARSKSSSVMSLDDDKSLDNDDDISFGDAAEAFMNVLLDNRLGKKALPLQCSKCIEDDTVSVKDKAKLWHRKDQLLKHQQGRLHSPYSKFVRDTEIAKEQHPRKKFVCPFCIGARQGEDDKAIGEFESWTALRKHIQLSQETDEGYYVQGQRQWNHAAKKKHDILKRQMGWYDSEWNSA